jgi:membrane-bound ClpP family serine protease
MIRNRCIIALLLLFALCVSSARADVVTLKDGTVYEGTVTEENSARVVIEIVISNIKTTKTFPRYKVRSVEYKPLEGQEEEGSDSEQRETTTTSQDDDESSVDDAENEERRPSARDRLAARKNRIVFVEVPVTGTIGVATNATGLGNALRQAKQRGVKHVVFTIDSGGGYLYDAIASLEILEEYDEFFEYHAVVDEGAISAASIYVAAADQIWVRPGSRVGGAVAYTTNASSGAAEVDAKLNSIWAAEVAARAVTKGHPPEVFRAMVEPGAELWVDDDGKAYPSRPSTPGAQQLDNASTVLTIRADQMVDIGMAKLFDGELMELGEMLDIESWSEAKRIGTRAMEMAGKERIELQEKYEDAFKVFRQTYEQYDIDHPTRFSDYYFYRTERGEYVPDGPTMIRWRERVDKTLRHIDIIVEALTRMADVNKRAAKIGAAHLEYVDDEVGDEVYRGYIRDRDWLKSNRNRGPEYD